MLRCSNCQTPYEAGQRFCVKCGAALTPPVDLTRRVEPTEPRPTDATVAAPVARRPVTSPPQAWPTPGLDTPARPAPGAGPPGPARRSAVAPFAFLGVVVGVGLIAWLFGLGGVQLLRDRLAGAPAEQAAVATSAPSPAAFIPPPTATVPPTTAPPAVTVAPAPPTQAAAVAPTQAAAPAPTTAPAPAAPTTAPGHSALVSDSTHLHDQLAGILGGLGPQASAVIVDPYGPLRVEYNPDVSVDAGAMLMLPVLIQTYQDVHDGRLHWTDRDTLDSNRITSGTGILQLHEGSTVDVRELTNMMIYYSDNTAANYLIDRETIPRINQLIQQLHLNGTLLGRRFNAPGDPTEQERKRTSTRDLATMLTLIGRDELVSPADSEDMRALLNRRGEIDPFWLGELYPANTPFGHLTGRLDGMRSDAGIVTVGNNHAYVFAIVLQGDHTPEAERNLEARIAETAQSVHQTILASVGSP